MNKHTRKQVVEQIPQQIAQGLERMFYEFLARVLACLDSCLDRRLVETFLALAIVIHRNRPCGLLLSELGGYVKPLASGGRYQADQQPVALEALRTEMSETYLWLQADERVTELSQAGQAALAIWGESVLEKPESLHLEGLCAVRSSKAVRLKRIKPGFFNPPGGCPIFVPGYHRVQVLVAGMEGPPWVVHMHWWTSRGEAAKTKRDVEAEILREVAER